MIWGLTAPESAAIAWSARAIYKNGIIDLLPDRQSWKGAGHEPLMLWLNGKGLDGIKEACDDAYLSTDSAETVVYREGGWVIKASPRQSYGYLYLVAYKEEG